VSIRLILCDVADLGEPAGLSAKDGLVEGGHLNEIAADWIVIPRARSAGKKSVTVEPSSTSKFMN
jgi:hypothetical protein